MTAIGLAANPKIFFCRSIGAQDFKSKVIAVRPSSSTICQHLFNLKLCQNCFRMPNKPSSSLEITWLPLIKE